MFTSRHIMEWIEGRITSGAKVYNDLIPASGRIICVRMGSGPGYDLEGIQDNLTFTLEVRGADRNYDDAEYIAREVDEVILRQGSSPWEFPDGEYMYYMGRTGGAPAQMLVSDTAGRYAFTGNYYACIATGL